MRLLPFILAALLCIGCQTAPPDYGTVSERYEAGATISPTDMRHAFFASEDLPARLERLHELEAQALAVVEDEPLKLGSIGSAILDTYVGSLTGHYVLMRFYEHVSNPKADFHRDWVTRIREDMEASGDGSREHPYPVVTPAEARIYAISIGEAPVGAMYHGNDPDKGPAFALLLQVRPEHGSVRNVSFDLSPLYQSMRDQLSAAAQKLPQKAKPAEPGAADPAADFNAFTLIGYLAKQNDSAAQTSVGAFLYQNDRFGDAVNWLRAASRTGNLLATTLLATIFVEQARATDNEEVREQALDQAMENYLHAIALGSGDAMYALAVLYLNGQYGEDNEASGVPLLEQASAIGHDDATVYLAHLHYAGEVVDKDLNTARRLYARAAADGNPYARKSYARFLLDREAAQEGDPRALDWLEALAEEEEDPESLLLLGNLHARGIGTRPSPRRAIRYYERAVKLAPTNPNIVNEVAWTLAVTDQRELRREDYAREIMDHLMENNEEARARPEYLDTWAATYAATGDFERAVALQQQAVDAATAAEYQEVLDILREHLAAFHAGETVSEAVP